MDEPNKGGRPTDYSQELVDHICARLADGESLRAVCRDDGMPDKASVFRWLRTYPEFCDQYARAKRESADTHSDDILEIVDDGRNDWMKANAEDDAGWKANGENIQRSRLRFDARRWLASKLNAKKYGDKLDVEHSGKLSIEQLVADSLVGRNAPSE